MCIRDSVKSIVFNENCRKTNCILGQKLVTAYGSDTIHDTMCGNDIEISPLSFYQVNTIQAERLYEIAADYAQLTGKETLLDLYCGAGTIGLSMSQKVKKLIGVEIIAVSYTHLDVYKRQTIECLCFQARAGITELLALFLHAFWNFTESRML